MTLEEFAREFLQDVLAESDADGQFLEDVFFQKTCEHLMEAGELDSADRAPYLGPPGRGIRVDGYGGDPVADDSDTLSLIVLDFHPSGEVGRLAGTEMNAIFRRLGNFLRHALDHRWRDALEETSPAFGLADLIAKRWNRLGRVRLFLITNRELSERVDGRAAEELDGRTITYSVWDIRRLYRQATVGHGREDIEIDLEEDFGGPLAVLPAQQGSSPVGGEILRQAPGRLEWRRMHAAMANDTSVSEFCTEQGIWASIKPLTLHLYVNPEGQLRAQGCARSSWAADGPTAA